MDKPVLKFFAVAVILVFSGSCSKPTVIVPEVQTIVVRKAEKVTEAKVNLVIPTGVSISEIVTLLAKAGFGSQSELLSASENEGLRKEFAIPGSSIEGYLLAGRYEVPRSESALAVFRNMLEQSRAIYKASERVKKADYYGLDSQKVLVLASILNKETCGTSEMKRMASVLLNRLAIGMPLQVDTTLVYFLKKPGNTLTNEDIKTPSPYNTYLNKTLPPTPICSPSVEAIDSVLNPEMTGYLYFYASGRCQHQFSENYRAHKGAIRELSRGGQETLGLGSPNAIPAAPPRRSTSNTAVIPPPSRPTLSLDKNARKPSVWELFNVTPRRGQ